VHSIAVNARHSHCCAHLALLVGAVALDVALLATAIAGHWLSLASELGLGQPPPVPELIEGELEYEVESVLAHRDVQVRRKKNRAKTPVLARQYLIKWKGFDESNNTWEPERNCSSCQDQIDAYFARIRAGAGTNKQKRTVDGGLQPVRSSKRIRATASGV
jgi:hypothetical protein